jgi:transposase
MSTKRRKYAPVEKAKIALEAIKGELTMAQIVGKYAVAAAQVSAWKKQVLASLPDAFSNKEKQIETEHALERASLYEEIGRLKMENDFLKKKFELFGK